MRLTTESCSIGEGVAFARAHGLAGRLHRDDLAAILNDPAVESRTAGLLALGFRAGFAACQEEDGERDD